MDDLSLHRLERRIAATERELAAAVDRIERLVDALEAMTAGADPRLVLARIDAARQDGAQLRVLTLTESRGGG